MTKEDEEYWKSLDWSWTGEWIYDNYVKPLIDKGLTEEQIIEEMKKYGDVKEIKKG